MFCLFLLHKQKEILQKSRSLLVKLVSILPLNLYRTSFHISRKYHVSWIMSLLMMSLTQRIMLMHNANYERSQCYTSVRSFATNTQKTQNNKVYALLFFINIFHLINFEWGDGSLVGSSNPPIGKVPLRYP